MTVGAASRRKEDIMKKAWRDSRETERNGMGLRGRRCAAGLAVVMAMGMTWLGACGSGAMDKASSSMELTQNAAMMDSYGMDSYETVNSANGVSPEESSGQFTQGSQEPSDNSAYYDQRKLIKTVNMDVETREFDGMLAAVETQVSSLGGYIESMNTYNGSRYSGGETNRTSSITARIPRDRLDGFLEAVSGAGNVISRSENVEDVTLAYVDMESRKKSLLTEQERLLALLENASDLDAILTIEDRLSTVRYQLENMEAQLRTYDNKVDFSTVYLSIREVKELTPVGEETLGGRIVEGFRDSLEDVGDGLTDFFVWFVTSIPYLALWAFILFVIILTIRLCIRRRRRKKAEKLQKLQSGSQDQNNDKK